MKIFNIDREILHIFWTTWRISTIFSGKIWHMIILKVTKIQGFTLSLEDKFLEKPQRESNCFPLSFIAAFKLLINNKSKFYSGVNSFSVIQNNKAVIDALNKLGNWKPTRSVSRYYFWTLEYDKQDNFNLNIIRMPYKSSKIVHKMFHSAIFPEILRVCKTTTKFQGCVMSAEKSSTALRFLKFSTTYPTF